MLFLLLLIEYSKNYVADLENDFAEIQNAANFVNANSDLPYDSAWKARKDFPVELETAIFDENNGVGFVYGGQEVKATHRPSLFEKETIDMNVKDSEFLNFIKTCIKFKKENRIPNTQLFGMRFGIGASSGT